MPDRGPASTEGTTTPSIRSPARDGGEVTLSALPVPPLLLDLDAVDDALRAVAEAREQLERLRSRARGLQDAVRWQAPSARAFRAGAEGVADLLSSGVAELELAADGLRRTRLRLYTEVVRL